MRDVGRPSVAVATAFTRSRGRAAFDGAPRQRLHPGAIALVAGFPGIVGAALVLAAFSRSGTSDGAFLPGVVILGVAAILLVLGLRSVALVEGDRLTVRFYGLRSTTVRLDELTSATFGMAAPSISYAITLKDRLGRKVLVHANWWRREGPIVRPVLQALLDHDVPMDRSTARIVQMVLEVPRPDARIVHHGLINKNRTW